MTKTHLLKNKSGYFLACDYENLDFSFTKDVDKATKFTYADAIYTQEVEKECGNDVIAVPIPPAKMMELSGQPRLM